jgi:hypothetical protein
MFVQMKRAPLSALPEHLREDDCAMPTIAGLCHDESVLASGFLQASSGRELLVWPKLRPFGHAHISLAAQ